MIAQSQEPKVLETLRTALADRRALAPNSMAENELLDAIGAVKELLAACAAAQTVLQPMAAQARFPVSTGAVRAAHRQLTKALRRAS